MLILFCEDPLRARRVDDSYQLEADALIALGQPFALVNFEALVYSGDASRAVRLVPDHSEPTVAVYRGWMLRPAQYAALYAALQAKGLTLINDPVAYQHARYLPENYPVIAEHTPRTVWLPLVGPPDFAAIHAALAPFGDRPVILKDYVKSQKHYWAEACFIPSAAEAAAVERVVRRFLELQDDQLNEGLVFREYVAFASLGPVGRGGLPLSQEFRVFVLDGEPLYAVNYWEQGDYAGLLADLSPFRAVMRQVRSRLYTMDIARRADGGWSIVELGDGQVAGLPENADLHGFYQALTERLAAGAVF